MIVSHRTPSIGMISAGVFLAIVAWLLPHLLSPGTPLGIYVASAVMHAIAFPLYAIGCCVYARGTGYPFYLGLFGLTGIGMLMLMLLPDRFPEPKDDDY